MPCRIFYRHDGHKVYILHVMRFERLLRKGQLTARAEPVGMKWYVRLIVAAGVALASGFVSALVLTIVDLYLTGHAQPSLKQETIALAGIGPKLSASDLLVMAGMIVPALATWFLLGDRK